MKLGNIEVFEAWHGFLQYSVGYFSALRRPSGCLSIECSSVSVTAVDNAKSSA